MVSANLYTWSAISTLICATLIRMVTLKVFYSGGRARLGGFLFREEQSQSKVQRFSSGGSARFRGFYSGDRARFRGLLFRGQSQIQRFIILGADPDSEVFLCRGQSQIQRFFIQGAEPDSEGFFREAEQDSGVFYSGGRVRSRVATSDFDKTS